MNGQLLLGNVDQYPVIDVTIDGADECVGPAITIARSQGSSCTSRVDLDLNCIKGGGGCHLRKTRTSSS